MTAPSGLFKRIASSAPRTATAVVVALAAIGAIGPSTAWAARTAWAPVASANPTNLPPEQSETQKVWVDAEGGTFTLSFNGQATPALAFDVAPATVEAQLNALSSVGGVGGSVSVVGGPGDRNADHPYSVTFGGALTNADVPLMTADSGSLTGTGSDTATLATVVPGGPGTTELAIWAQNIGGAISFGTVTINVALPPGIVTTKAPFTGAESTDWTCSGGAGATTFSCTTSTSANPGMPLKAIIAPVRSEPGAVSGEPVEVSVSGGGASGLPAEYEMPLTISALPPLAGFQSFVAGAYDDNGIRDVRAGAHPYSASTAIMVNTIRNSHGLIVPVGDPKDIMVDLPPGFLGNPIAVPQCPASTSLVSCPTGTTVGIVKPLLGFDGYFSGENPVKDIEAPYGYPAKVEFDANGFNVDHIGVLGELRSDKDYGVTFGTRNTPEILPVYGAFFAFWGSPSDPTHDAQRKGPSEVAEPVAFATNATDCSTEAIKPPITTLNMNTWQNPAQIFSSSITLPPVTECEKLKFEADFTFEPSGPKSDSPASFTTSLTVPSEGLTNPLKRTTPEIKEAVVKLPKGVALSPAAADGLQACSEEQIGLLGTNFPAPNPMRFNKDPNACPNASKIGTGELKSALLEDTLHGALYLAAQGKGNPFGSLFAVYLVIEDPRHGIFIKLPGEVEPDKQTGQFQVTFSNLPQLPFTSLKLNLKGGNRAALASPTTCGNFVTTAVNTPWSAPESGPPSESANGFEITQGPNGLPCAKTPQERPFDVGWKAGSSGTVAGAHSPFTFQITRPDGSQELETLELNTPPGLSASLKGIPYCTEADIKAIEARTGNAERAGSACPVASQVGSLQVGSGAGPTPFYTGGKLYLAGPYKGAPISVVAVTPAVAGPFDLGNVVARSALFVNRSTAQVTAKSDPIPQILEGVPLRIRDIRIFLDRKDWTSNPTDCDASATTVHVTGNSGATANLSSRFQVGGCNDLAFKPSLTAKVTGGTKRNDHPAFTAEVNYPPGPGYANLKDVRVALPHSEFLDQAHINTVCTRVQAAAHECPPGSIYGEAEATTPLLDGVLKGPVFLKSSSHQLPDLAIALEGPDNQPIEVEFAGRIDSVHGQIRNTIEGLPDVPVTKFVLRMKGGKKGLLVNSRNLCKGKPGRMTVNTVGQNNKRWDTRPKLGNSCGKKAAKKHNAHKAARFSLAAISVAVW